MREKSPIGSHLARRLQLPPYVSVVNYWD